jgi:hypothetical protein
MKRKSPPGLALNAAPNSFCFLTLLPGPYGKCPAQDSNLHPRGFKPCRSAVGAAGREVGKG